LTPTAAKLVAFCALRIAVAADARLVIFALRLTFLFLFGLPLLHAALLRLRQSGLVWRISIIAVELVT
jgi:hypothetical protein